MFGVIQVLGYNTFMDYFYGLGVYLNTWLFMKATRRGLILFTLNCGELCLLCLDFNWLAAILCRLNTSTNNSILFVMNVVHLFIYPSIDSSYFWVSFTWKTIDQRWYLISFSALPPKGNHVRTICSFLARILTAQLRSFSKTKLSVILNGKCTVSLRDFKWNVCHC